MELSDLRKLSGLNECGMGPMPSSSPPSPASISMTAASGSELSGMLKDIMSLAGMTKVEPAQLGVVPPPMKMTAEPVKAVGPIVGDGEVMRGIADKLNLDKDDKEMKADEAWDNTPADAEPKKAFDAEEFAYHPNPPGAGKGRGTAQPNATVESVQSKLWEDYNQFKIEENNNDLRYAVISVLKDIYIGAKSGQNMIDTIADELGDHYQDVEQSGDARLQQAYRLMRDEGAEAEGDPEAQRRIANNALELLDVDAEQTARWHGIVSGDDEEDELEENDQQTLQYHSMDEIIDMLGEHDLFKLEKMGFRYGDKPTDEDLLNAYLEDSDGAWFSNLRVKSGKEVEEEKSWFDMDSKERAAYVAGGKPKAHRSGGQPGHGAAPAKTGKGDAMRQASSTKSELGKQDYKGKEDDFSENADNNIVINGKQVDKRSIEVDGVDPRDYGDFADAYASYATFVDGTELNDDELIQLTDEYGDVVNELAHDSMLGAADYDYNRER